MRIGIDIRSANPAAPGQERYLWRLGTWLAGQRHEVHFLTVRSQPEAVSLPASATLHRLHRHSPGRVRIQIAALGLDALMINPERAGHYRGLRANVLRAAYGTEHYLQKLRSFRHPAERALRRAWRLSPWVLAEQRRERDFYVQHSPAPQVIAQSHYLRREIQQSYGVPEDRLHVIYNGVDTGEFSTASRARRRAAARARWSLPEEAICLLLLGHNYRLKGLWQILSLLPPLTDMGPVHVLVAGRGTGSLQRLSARRRIRRTRMTGHVTLAGPVYPSIEALAAADAVVHLSWHDAFGLAVLEAMACGLPVVTTCYAGASELIRDRESGLIVDPADDAQILRAIQRLGDPAVRARIGAAAADIGVRFDETRNFAEVLRVLEYARECSPGPVR